MTCLMGSALIAVTGCSASVSMSTSVRHLERSQFPAAWPFKADSVTVACQRATGHPTDEQITVDGVTYRVLDPFGASLPDGLWLPSRRNGLTGLGPLC